MRYAVRKAFLQRFQPIILFESTALQSTDAIKLLRKLGSRISVNTASAAARANEALYPNRAPTHDVIAAPSAKFSWMCRQLSGR